MNLFDIVGPVMVGPSSSHTAGAVRIGFVAQKLLGEPVKRARIGLYGSFLATGTGHGTQKALIAGLLGMAPDDMRIPDSFHLAEEKGIEFSFEEANLKEAHPNSAELELEGISGRSLTARRFLQTSVFNFNRHSDCTAWNCRVPLGAPLSGSTCIFGSSVNRNGF